MGIRSLSLVPQGVGTDLEPLLCIHQFNVSRADLPTATIEELLGPVDDRLESMLAMTWAVVCLLRASPSEG
jgi:hypothetical protein